MERVARIVLMVMKMTRNSEDDNNYESEDTVVKAENDTQDGEYSFCGNDADDKTSNGSNNVGSADGERNKGIFLLSKGQNTESDSLCTLQHINSVYMIEHVTMK